jgi:hypothetical protein
MATGSLAIVKACAAASLVISAALLSGCASTDSPRSDPPAASARVTVTDPSRLTRSGFLSSYERLAPTPRGGGIECWRDPRLDARKYDRVMISRIVVSLSPQPGKDQTVDPSDLKMLTDYFHNALANALRPQMPIVQQAGPGVVVIRIALTDLVPTGVTRSVTGTLIPYGFVAEAGSGPASGRPAGSTPYLGTTGMEMQFLDGGSATVLAECRDTEVGRKYAAEVDSGASGAAETWASGYLNSFQAWSYAKNAFDKWSLLVAQRFAALKAGEIGR